MTGRACASWIVVALAACTNVSRERDLAGSGSAAPSPAPAIAAPTTELLATMASLVGEVPEAGELARWTKQIASGEVPLSRYIDELLASERFAREIVPNLVFSSYGSVRNYYALPNAFTLQRTASLDATYYLRAPCTTDEATVVRPWWDLANEVKVCPDAYRPEKWTMTADEHSYRTQLALACDSQVGSPESETQPLCGCGPNLIRCMRDAEQYDDFNASMMNEVKQTTAYVVQHDLPIASLFTGNETFRDRNAELYYRRQKIGALELSRVERELASLARWPVEGRWAPREEVRPGQHAGVLTAPQILHWLPDRRQRQRAYYEILWCNMTNTFGATTRKVLELNAAGNNFFVHESWAKLAHTELCTNCHARLDYGFQFFLGYPDSRASTHFMPALHAAGTGPLYGQDINDVRGEAPLTPLGFAKLATAQPDFHGCMAGHFVDYVLGERATEDDVRAIAAAVAEQGTFKASMRVALERFAERWRADARATSPAGVATPVAAAGAPGSVVVGPELRAALDRGCVDCHDEQPTAMPVDGSGLPHDFTPRELPRSLLVAMTDQVAFGMMPKDQPLEAPAREALVRTLIGSLWEDPAARAEAERYYLGQGRGLPAHQFDNTLHAVSTTAAGTSDLQWGALERGIWTEQATVTPGVIAVTTLDAVRACVRAGTRQGAAFAACLRRATAPSLLSRSPASSR